MSHFLASLFSFSIFLPGVIAAFLFKKIDKSYYPFIFSLWIGCINELLSSFLIYSHRQNLVNNNIYVFVESVLLCWYFAGAEVFRRRENFYMIVILLSVTWFAENFIFRSIFVNSTYFRIFASIIIAGLSIELFNKILLDYHPNIFKNSDFILACCFIIYFIYKALIQAFIIYGASRNVAFFAKIYAILIYINLGVNLFYIPAVLWMPRKARFILPLS